MLRSLTLCVVWVAVSAGESAAVTVYDLKADFSDSSNPNGAWSYRDSDDLLPSVADWDTGANIQPAWAHVAPPTLGHIPSLFQATNAAENWLVGDIVGHAQDSTSGPGLGTLNITWTAPAAGTVDVVGSVWQARRNLGRASDWSLQVDGVEIASGQLSDSDGNDRSNPELLSSGAGDPGDLLGIAVDPGDQVRLYASNAASFGEFVGFNLTITLSDPIPEPASLTMFAAAGALMMRRRRRCYGRIK